MAAAAALTLAACGAEPYPNPAPQPPPPPPPPADLAGAAVLPPVVSSSTTTTTYSSTTPGGTTYSSTTTSYSDSSSPVIIAMAPIPNPGHGGRREHYVGQVAPHAVASGYRYIAPARPAHPVVVGHGKPLPYKIAPKLAVAKAVPKAVAKAPAKIAAAAKAGVAAGAAAVAAATAPPKDANAQGASPLGDRATRLAALESTLADAVHKGAELKAPSPFTAGKAADVTLTVPADFGQTVKDEAAKNDLSDAAASVNLTAVLSGDGFSVTPDTAQSQPLTPGQPTEFHWTVTAQEGAKGPLHADVGADLLGAGSDVLNLGSVQAGSAFGIGFLKSNRMLGVGILAVLAVLVLAWLARGRSGPSRSASARREARRARTDRPVMLGDSEL